MRTGERVTKMNKYRNKKIKVGEKVYDSKKEMRRHQQLLLLEKNGEISDLQMQVKFVLIPAQYSNTEITKNGKFKCLERECVYIADFVYKDQNGQLVVEDVKSKITRQNPTYIIKRKLMLYKHGLKITEI